MFITSAQYLISSPSVTQCPKPDRPEFAFIGRSNVGKSSLINAVTNKKELAKTSGTPGKTQLINHFEIVTSDKRNLYFVDLPGYGFAKVAQKQRKGWQTMIEDYIRKRESLVCLFVLIDSRHTPQQLDLEFVDKLGEWQVPFALIFTKADKSTQRESAAHVRQFLTQLEEKWQELPPHFLTSAIKRTGVSQILSFMNDAVAR